MKNSILSLRSALIFGLMGLAPLTARADGFVCESTHESLRIQVYNQTQPEAGTRNVAVMVLSDPSKPQGARTLARFRADHDDLSNSGARYTAVLDPAGYERGQTVQDIQIGQLQEISTLR